MAKLEEMRKRFWNEYYCKWEYYIEGLKQQEDLDEEVKSKALWGIEQLQKIFDENWLKSAFESPRHPLFTYLLNMAPWSRLWIFDFGRKINEFKHFSNFQELERRLGNADQFGGAKTELDVAWLIKNNGFEVELIPHRNNLGDIKTVINRNDVHIEVTRLATTEEERTASENLNALMYPHTFDRDIHISFKIHKILAKPVIEDLQKRVKRAVDEAKAMKRCVEVCELGVLDFFVSPKEKHEELKKWRKSKNLVGGCCGPPIKVDEVRRIKSRIGEKNKQLPPNKAGIVVIDATTSLFFDRTEDYWGLADKVDQKVLGHRNLIAGVIIGPFHTAIGENYPNEKNKIYRKGSNAIVSRDDFLNKKAFLIIKNNYSRFKKLNAKLEELFYQDDDRNKKLDS